MRKKESLEFESTSKQNYLNQEKLMKRLAVSKRWLTAQNGWNWIEGV
jgi:hypothetical protein